MGTLQIKYAGLCFYLFLVFIFLRGAARAEPDWLKEAIAASDTVVVDHDAPAFIIFDKAEVDLSGDGKSKLRAKYAVKILSSLGEEYSIERLGIHSARKIKNLKGWQCKKNGEANELKDENVITADLEMAAGYYDDSRTIIASFPNVEAGDVIAYEYEIIETEPWSSNQQQFYFHDLLPVLQTYFSVKLPSGWKYNVSYQNLEVEPEKIGENEYVWKSGFRPYRPDEPYMPERKETMSYLDVSFYDSQEEKTHLFVNWNNVGNWANSLYEDALATDADIMAMVQSIKSESNESGNILETVAGFVRDDIRYVAVEIGEGRFKPRLATSTLANRYGDCKDKSMLMIALLRGAGVNAMPVLALVGDKIDIDFPSPFQFNHVIVAIELTDPVLIDQYRPAMVDKWLFFDPTDPSIKLGELPYPLYGSIVLLIEKKDSHLIELPELTPAMNKAKKYCEATLNQNNTLEAAVRMSVYGRGVSSLEYKLRANPAQERIKSYQEYFSRIMLNPSISDFKTEILDDSGITSFTVRAENYAQTSGQMTILGIDIFNSGRKLEKNKDERYFPVTFGQPALDETEIIWSLPEGWTADSGTDSIRAECGLGQLDSFTDITDSTVHYKSSATYNGATLPAGEYNQIYKFLKKLKVSRDEVAIIKKH